jgi:hypothetical protein
VEVFYGFGDASGAGSCTNFQSVVQRTVNERPSFDLGDKVYYRYGHWCDEVSEESSNYRTLIKSLELQVREGQMAEAEVFFFHRQFYGRSGLLQGELYVEEAVTA